MEGAKFTATFREEFISQSTGTKPNIRYITTITTENGIVNDLILRNLKLLMTPKNKKPDLKDAWQGRG